MAIAKCRCKYRSKIYLLVDLARECGVSPEVLRCRFKAAKSTVKYRGRKIPVLTDFDLRPVGSTKAGFSRPSIMKLNREWLSRALVRSSFAGREYEITKKGLGDTGSREIR